jgi:hypothetical protein
VSSPPPPPPWHPSSHFIPFRDRLRAIISDFRTQTSLREGCNAILRSDCLHLVTRLQREVQRALPTVWLQRLHTHAATAAVAAAAAADGSDTAAAAAAGEDSTPAGGTAAKGVSKAATAVAAAAGGAHPYLPVSSSSKGPQWLKYQCGSGRAMQAASTQEVPAVAVHALAAVTAAAGVAPVGGPAAAAAGSRAGGRSTTGIKVRGGETLLCGCSVKLGHACHGWRARVCQHAGNITIQLGLRLYPRSFVFGGCLFAIHPSLI